MIRRARDRTPLNVAVLAYYVLVTCSAAAWCATAAERITAAAIASTAAWTVVLSHRSELLRFRRLWLVAYTLMGLATGIVGYLLPPDEGLWIFAFLLSGLGMSPLLIPGTLRFVLYYLRRVAGGTTSAGGIEAISLLTTYAPGQIERLRDALRYPLSDRPRRHIIRTLLTGELVITALVAMLSMTQDLTTAAVYRRYSAGASRPRLELSSVERLVYLAGPLLLLGIRYRML